jgi:hypothetical protein
MPPQSQEYYGRALDKLDQRAANGVNGLPPEKVAEVVSHALTSRRPRVRYMIGRDARIRLWLQRILPASVKDRIVLAALRRM